MATRPKAKARAKTYEEFVFLVRTPSLSYHFGIELDRKRREWRPFDETEEVNFITECIWPDRFKGRETGATLRPEPAFVDHTLLGENDVLRKWIGYIRATKGEFDTAIGLPPAACWRLSEAMASGLVRSMLANTIIQPRGMHRVIYASFHGQAFDPVEYVG